MSRPTVVYQASTGTLFSRWSPPPRLSRQKVTRGDPETLSCVVRSGWGWPGHSFMSLIDRLPGDVWVISWICPACYHLFVYYLYDCASSPGRGDNTCLLSSPGQEHSRFSVNIRCCSQHPLPPTPTSCPFLPELLTVPFDFHASTSSLRLLWCWSSPWFLQRAPVLTWTAQSSALYTWQPWLLFDALDLFL